MRCTLRLIQIDINELVFSCIYCRHKIITTTRDTHVHTYISLSLSPLNKSKTEKQYDDCKLYVCTDTQKKICQMPTRVHSRARECDSVHRQPNILILHIGISVSVEAQRTWKKKPLKQTNVSTKAKYWERSTARRSVPCRVYDADALTFSKSLLISALQMTLQAFHLVLCVSLSLFFLLLMALVNVIVIAIIVHFTRKL